MNNLCSSDLSVVKVLICTICGLRKVVEDGGVFASEDLTRDTTEVGGSGFAIERDILIDERGVTEHFEIGETFGTLCIFSALHGGRCLVLVL